MWDLPRPGLEPVSPALAARPGFFKILVANPGSFIFPSLISGRLSSPRVRGGGGSCWPPSETPELRELRMGIGGWDGIPSTMWPRLPLPSPEAQAQAQAGAGVGWGWGHSLDSVGHAVGPHAPHHAQLLQRCFVLPLLGEDLLFGGFRLHELLPPLGGSLDVAIQVLELIHLREGLGADGLSALPRPGGRLPRGLREKHDPGACRSNHERLGMNGWDEGGI